MAGVGARQAEALMKRFGWSYEQLLGLRFAINVALGATLVWYSMRLIVDSSPIWAIASMVAASEPEVNEAFRMFRCRLINVLVGCAVGLVFTVIAAPTESTLPLALGATVLISSYAVRVKTMWRQAPITAAIVIAAGITSQSSATGMAHGLHKVAQVLFGCLVGLLVSWVMSKVWLVQPPQQEPEPGR